MESYVLEYNHVSIHPNNLMSNSFKYLAVESIEKIMCLTHGPTHSLHEAQYQIYFCLHNSCHDLSWYKNILYVN